jgi:hypothetical protein
MLIQPIGAGFTASAQEQSIPKESATGLQTVSLLFWVDFFVPRHRLSCSAAFAPGLETVWPLPMPSCSSRLFQIVGKTRRTPCRSEQRLEKIPVCS